MPRKTILKTTPGNKTQPKLVVDLGDVEAAHRQSFIVDISMCGQTFRFEGRRLIPSESAKIKQMMELAIPPMIPGEKPGDEPRYNFQDADYMQRRETARVESRAYALWLGYPCFKLQAEKLFEEWKRVGDSSKGIRKVPETVQEIATFIQGRAMDDDALQLLFISLAQPVRLEEAVGFFSGKGSPKS